MEFLDVKTDFAFKKVFGSEQSKGILISFLNALIDFEKGDIVDLTIVDPYQIPLLQGMKDTFVDVKAVLSTGKTVIIEMQVLNVPGFEKRVLYNAAKSYSSQLMKSQNYDSLQPIIALTITDFVMFEELPNVMSYWSLHERDVLVKYSGDIELIFVELPKFTKTEPELTSITDKWIFFLQQAGKLDFIPTTFTEPSLREAFEIANTASLSRTELEIQFKRRDFIWLQKGALVKAEKDGFFKGIAEGFAQGVEQGVEQGIKQGVEQGIKQGIEQGVIATAQKMLQNGIDIALITQITGLSRQTIEAIST